jgi:hypothetical protein
MEFEIEDTQTRVTVEFFGVYLHHRAEEQVLTLSSCQVTYIETKIIRNS